LVNVKVTAVVVKVKVKVVLKVKVEVAVERASSPPPPPRRSRPRSVVVSRESCEGAPRARCCRWRGVAVRGAQPVLRDHGRPRRTRARSRTSPGRAADRLGRGRGEPQSASAGAAARLAPRDDSADHSPVFYAGGFGHPAIENDIREIRKLLKSYVTRLENKDAAARTTKEWRIVARVLDRIFFFCYIGTIVVSLFTIFPRDGGERESGVQELRAVTLTL